MKIWLVEDTGNSPGRIYGCFADREDAEHLSDAIDEEGLTETDVVQRTLIYGQASIKGFNP